MTKQNRARQRSARCAFTLLELLATIGIIALLAALLSPMVSKMRRGAEATQCMSNLRQVYLLFSNYTQDYDSQIPPAFNSYGGKSVGVESGQGWLNAQWNETMEANTKKVFGCPEQRSYVKSKTPAAYRPDLRTFSMNSILANDYWNGPGDPNNPSGGASGAPSKRTMQFFQYPSKSLIFSDGAYDGSPYNSGVNGGNKVPQAVHDGSANICFLDGHTERIKQADIPLAPASLASQTTLGTPASIFWLGR